jgi:hypothetical protein
VQALGQDWKDSGENPVENHKTSGENPMENSVENPKGNPRVNLCGKFGVGNRVDKCHAKFRTSFCGKLGPSKKKKKKREGHTQWNSQETNDNLDGTEGVENGSGLCLVGDQPVVGLEGQSEAEEVLEDDLRGEALDDEIACLRVLSTC